jgi:predicted O-methyltransferase YrrM
MLNNKLRTWLTHIYLKLPPKLIETIAFLLAWLMLKTRRFDSQEKLLNFTFGIPGRIVCLPWQNRQEIAGLLQILTQRKPVSMIEIGSLNGGTLLLFCRTISPKAEIISIDFPDFVSRFSGYKWYRSALFDAFKLKNQTMHVIEGNSCADSTLNKVRSILKGRKADFLFIDGDHRYEGVKKDFETYGPMVNQNGIIAFHDIAAHPNKAQYDVNRLWKEIDAGTYDKKEIIQDPDSVWCGIGLLTEKSPTQQ